MRSTKPKKTKRGGKLLAGLALATALAYGSIPAFATDEPIDDGSETGGGTTEETEGTEGGSGDNTGDNGDESTSEKLKVPEMPVGDSQYFTPDSASSVISGYATDNYEADDSMISAKIPAGLYMAFNTAGYSDILVSSSDVYGITNTGGVDIKVSDIEVNPISEEFVIDAMYEDNGTYFYDEKPVDKNILMLQYNDGTNHTYLSADHPLKRAVRNDKFLNNDFKPFSISTIKAGEFMGIDMSGSFCYFPKAITAKSEGAEGQLCTLVFHIEEA